MSYFSIGLLGPLGPGLAPLIPTPITIASIPPPNPFIEPGLLAVTALARVYIVKDTWREWQEGLAGRPAIRELEEHWGSH